MNNGHSPDMQVLRGSQTLGPLIGIFKSTNGTHWTRMNAEPMQDDLETTVAKLQFEHAIHSPNSWIRVVDMKSGQVIHNQTPVVPHREIEQFFPPVDDEERLAQRELWTERVIEWCMGEALLRHVHGIANEKRRHKLVRAWLKRHKIVVETHLNGARRVMRKGKPIAEWLA